MFKISKKKQILSGKIKPKKVENCQKWANMGTKMGGNGPKLHENFFFRVKVPEMLLHTKQCSFNMKKRIYVKKFTFFTFLHRFRAKNLEIKFSENLFLSKTTKAKPPKI